MFNENLFVNEFTNNFTSNLSKSGLDKNIAEHLINVLKLKQLKITIYDDFMLNDFINNELGINLDSAFGFPASQIIKQYLVPILKANSSLEKDVLFSSKPEVKFLKKYSDSIIYLASDEGDNPYIFDANNNRIHINAKLFFDYAQIIQKSDIYNIGFSLYYHFLDLNKLTISNSKELSSQIKSKTIETKLGKIAIGGSGNDNYNGNYLLIIDLGGNDKYSLTDLSKELALLIPVTCIVDFSGKDYYSSGDFSLGGGYFGVNILMDYSGDDRYNSGNISLGGALFGFGLLQDFSGNDVYTGKNFSSGAAAFGIGILIDESGNDVYNSHSYSQGFGYTRGFGLLFDIKGNDNYISSSPQKDVLRYQNRFISFTQGAALGYRPLASGGIGLLTDLEGNDKYNADIFGQGTGYWYSLGSLLDFDGDDNYQAYQYSQGSGVHLGFGNLHDYSGNDVYLTNSVSQGCGHDFAYGSLFDLKGSDKYIADNLSLGGGNANSISLFFDRNGDDSYLVNKKDNSMGYSDLRRDLGMIGLFIDGGGNDKHCDTINNNKILTKSTYGAYIDIDFPFIKMQKGNNETNTKKIIIPYASDSLNILASNQLDAFQIYCQPAKDSLIKKGKSVLPIIIKNLESYNPRALQTLEYVLNGLLKSSDSIDVKKAIIDSLNSKNRTNFAIFSRVLSRNCPDNAKPFLLFRLDDPDWRIVETAILALAKYNDVIVSKNIEPLLISEHPLIRARAAHTIGTIKAPEYLQILSSSFLDTFQIVRNSALQGITSNLSADFDFAKMLFTSEIDLKIKQKLIKFIANIELSDKEFKEFLKLLAVQNFEVRKTFYSELSKHGKSKFKKKISQIIKNETDLELKKILTHE
jgi:HEAT repeat protein